MNVPSRPRPRALGVFALGASLLLATTSCAKSASTPSANGGSAAPQSSAGAQQLETPTPAASGAAPAAAGCTLAASGTPTGLQLKNLVVGFSQSEPEANPFRIAETASIRAEAAKIGVKKLLVTNAQATLSKQISDIQDMIAQGAQALIVAPFNSTGLEPALAAATAKHIPVVAIDRKLTGATPCKDYLTFIGSNFVQQGQRAAAQMITATGGKGKVVILLGTSGNNVTTDRTAGFLAGIKGTPSLQVVAQQTGNFKRQDGQTVTEQFLQSHPDLTAVYAENDEMALGAVVALRDAGKTPGKTVKIVSVDGTRNAVQQIVNGSINAVIESNPRFGPLAFSTLKSFLSGTAISPALIISDKQYDASNAKSAVVSAY